MHQISPPVEVRVEKVSQAGEFSYFWDLWLPLAFTAPPMILMTAVRWYFSQPRALPAQPPEWSMVLLIVLELAWIVSLALLVFIRAGRGIQQLDAIFANSTPPWRKRLVLASVGCLTIVDVTGNLSSIPGGEFLRWGALVFYAAYLLFMKLAFLFARHDAEFARLTQSH